MGYLDISLIYDVPPFQGLKREELRTLLGQANSQRFAKGDYIFSQGEKVHSFFVLLDGHIKVVKITANGEQVIARFISSGELFGIATALGLSQYPANAIAAVDCVALAWPDHKWKSIAEAYPAFATNTYHMVGERLQESQDRLVEMATERVEQRVANAILNLANQTGKKTDEGVLIDFPITRQEISEMTGSTLHTVSRLLSTWEGQGIIRSSRKKIVVIEGHKIMLLANGDKKVSDFSTDLD